MAKGERLGIGAGERGVWRSSARGERWLFTNRRLSLRARLLRGAVVVVIAVGFIFGVVAAAKAEPPAISEKRAEAEQVLAQVRELDSRLAKTIETYNLARIRLDRTEHSLLVNGAHLKVAKQNLHAAQTTVAQRLVALYKGDGPSSMLVVLFASSGLSELLDRLDTANRVAEQDAQVVREVLNFNATVRERRVALVRARTNQRRYAAQLEAERASIDGQIAERNRLLGTIKDQIAQLQAEERQRQAELRRQAQARLAAQQEAARRSAELARQTSADTHVDPPVEVVGAGAVTPDGSTIAPDARYTGVVGIAMQYLGVPYLWGGASPSTGFDCSGFIMYVYAKVGVSLPHYAASQYTYGVGVSRDQLEPGDLVFFDGLGHNGIYIGGDQFIHAPHTGDVVKISSLTDAWYAARWVGARRL